MNADIAQGVLVETGGPVARGIQSERPLPVFVLDMLSSAPRRGGGLNNWFFRAARCLHPYRSPVEIRQLLEAATAGLPLQRGEIERAIVNSKHCAWRPDQVSIRGASRGWPAVDRQRRDEIAKLGFGLVDLWEASALRCDDDGHAELIVDILFPGNPLLCVGSSRSKFATRRRSEWEGRLSELQLMVPSPMNGLLGRTQDGKESAHTLENTGPRRFLVIEQDLGTLDEQAGILAHLATHAPLALAVFSGGKSLHGWFSCGGQREDRLRSFMAYAVSLGADRALWTRSQFVRIPDGLRDNGVRQSVYYFNPSAIL